MSTPLLNAQRWIPSQRIAGPLSTCLLPVHRRWPQHRLDSASHYAQDRDDAAQYDPARPGRLVCIGAAEIVIQEPGASAARQGDGSCACLGDGKAILEEAKARNDAPFNDEIEDELRFDQLPGSIDTRRKLPNGEHAIALHHDVLELKAL